MTILAIDTSMAACSAAILADGGGAALLRFEPMTRGHAEAIFAMVADVMAEAECGFDALSAIAVTIGPGSFTGVRAGLAAARGFALAAKVPVIGVTSLEVMAQKCVRERSEAESGNPFAIVQDARREEAYVQLFDAAGTPLDDAEILPVIQIASELSATIGIAYGSGAVMLSDQMQARGRTLQAGLPDLLPDAACLAHLAAGREPAEHPPAPLYLRPPDAKPQTGKSFERVIG
ncbi:MAG: tRNA (adenosine(37)-N6)-threonylcarbamoyltransferase complex dimerization subunit type 1 TsaB [Hyphomicrobiales bacterium]|nr:tRNA (adenosine(37)-N6)-threonylcarbamoyltransferase complex dimerization subunit type 1 TsaB [Hyphomicrobiales bacterium]